MYGGTLWFIGADGTTADIDLAGKTLRQVAQEINADYGDARAVSKYPEYDARYLDRMGPDPFGPRTQCDFAASTGPDDPNESAASDEPSDSNGQVRTGGSDEGEHPNDPDAATRSSSEDTEEDTSQSASNTVAIGSGTGGVLIEGAVGTLFGLAELDEDGERGSLLSDGGIQLDAIATYPISWDLFLRLRMTFATNDPQSIKTTEAGGESGSQSGPTLSSVVSGADRFSLGADIEWIATNSSTFDLGLHASAEVSWTSLDAFQFPSVVPFGGGAAVPLEDLYPTEVVASVKRRIDRVLPVSTLLAGPSLQMPTGANRAYLLLSLGVTERIARSLDFDATTSAEPAMLADATTGEFEGIWRVGLGLEVGDAFNLRTDAIGPLRRGADVDPVLRLQVSKSFMLKN